MTMEQQTKELERLKLGALRAKFHEVLGTETKSNNRPYLIKKILQALQPRRVEHKQNEVADDSGTSSQVPTRAGQRPARQRDPRLPPSGTILERDYQGKTLRAKVLDDGGISFRGKTYSSLSQAALAATGTVWNGFVFWNLAKRPQKSTPASTT